MLEYSCVSENLPAGREKVYGVIKLEKDNTEQPKMKSLDKALKLLECFGSVTPELGITELARILELHKSNVFNIVATFEQHGYLEKNKATGKYRLGLKLLEFSYLINENLGYQRVLYDIMKEVSNELGAITYFAVLRGQKVFYLCSAYPHKKGQSFSLSDHYWRNRAAVLYVAGKGDDGVYAFGRTGGLSYAISFLSHLYTIYHNRAGPAETGSRLDSRKKALAWITRNMSMA